MLFGTLAASILGNALQKMEWVEQEKTQLKRATIFNVASSFNPNMPGERRGQADPSL